MVVGLKGYHIENGSYTLHLDNVGVYEQNDFILTVVEKNGEKKYLKIETVQPGDDLVFNYTDLSDYDHTITIDVPSNFINQTYFQLGMEEQITYITNGNYGLDEFEAGKSSNNPPNVITLAFLNDLPIAPILI